MLAMAIELSRAFSEPLTSADTATDYLPTQLITEHIKNRGFDGIAYESAQANFGKNFVIFNPDSIDFQNQSNSFTRKQIKSVTYSYF